MSNLTKSLFVAALGLASVAPANAAVTYVERFDEPFAGWEDRFFGTRSNAQNYYRTEPSGAPADFRGGNTSGLWISDGDNYTFPGYNGNVNIRFDAAFARNLRSLSMDVASLLGAFGSPLATLVFYDADGAQISSMQLPLGTISPNGDPMGYMTYSVNSATGIGGFDLLGYAQGSVSVDNIIAVAVPEPTTWAMMIGGFGVVGGAMRRRQAALRTVAA